MDLLKALKYTIIASAAALGALGATAAFAGDQVNTTTTTTGHVSASVQGTLKVVEEYAVRFGNLSVICKDDGTGTSLGNCVGGTAVTMTDTGDRSAPVAVNGSDTILLLTRTTGHGAGTDNENPGIDGGGGHDTGGQGPGIYRINTSDDGTPGAGGGVDQTAANVYVTFANNNGEILDATYDPNAFVDVSNGTNDFHFDHLTFGKVGTTSGNPTLYNPTAHGNDDYGNFITLAGGTAKFQVGGQLSTVVGNTSYSPGKYTGTFYVMVSY
jgi:hypothetical protein